MLAAEEEIQSMNKKLDLMLTMMDGFDSWRPTVDTAVANLDRATADLRSRVTALETSAPPPPSASLRDEEERATGHGVDPQLHGDSLKKPKGESQFTKIHTQYDYGESSRKGYPGMHSYHSSSYLPRMPKTEFPKFDGDNPKWWKDKCEKYFDMYNVPSHSWASFATMHFTSTAALWLQTYEIMHRIDSWPELVVAVNNKFGKDKYQQYIDELLHIQQISTVGAYHAKFEELMHRVLIHNGSYDETFFVSRFIQGLKEEIRSVIKLHKPRTVDSALSLARMQEELCEHSSKKKSYYKSDFNDHFKKDVNNPNSEKGILGASPEEAKKPESKAWGDKYDSLKAMLKAKGLCFKCREKFGPNHKCPKNISLHILEELLDLLQLEEGPTETSDAYSGSDSEEMFMSLSLAAANGGSHRKTIKLLGIVGNQKVLILIDSGSSNSFISDKLVQKLSCPLKPIPPAPVVIADGKKLISDKMVSQLEWWTQGHTFNTDVKVLNIGCYDIILGMDWLSDFSPMWVHWRKKIMRFSHKKQRITLNGIKDNVKSCKLISANKVNCLLRKGDLAQVVKLNPVCETKQQEVIPPEVQELVQKNAAVFSEPTDLPPQRSCDHSIPLLDGAKPVNLKPYRYSPQLKDEMEKQITEMLQKGIIQHSTSPFSSPVLLVKKKDGTWRFCVDFRKLNAMTVKNKYPMPIVEELLDELNGAMWFTKLDLRSGYHQIRLVNRDEHKTAFKTHQGHYEFKVMPFGLTNAPATFQAVMNDIFADLNRKCVLVFVDDILVYSKTLEEHLQHLQAVFDILAANQFYVKASKCSFAQQKLEYLGHIISIEGVATNPSKIQVIQQWPIPQNAKQLRGFLGLAGYYRKFIKHYGIMSKSLTDLLKKNCIFHWSQVEQQAFNAIKQALTSAPVLKLPDFSKEFVIETDASAVGIGAVLMQGGHPLAFLSKVLGPKNQGLSTYEKECLAVLLAVDKWRAYLQHAEFAIQTDQKSLTQLVDNKLITPMQQKAFVKLMGLQFRIHYKKGIDNKVADALSRLPREDDQEEVQAISVCRPKWLSEVVAGYTEDEQAKKLLTELAVQPTPPNSPYSLSEGIIRYKGKVWIGNNTTVQQSVLRALHDSGLGGHSGITATYQRIQSLFAWPGMKKHIEEYIQQCAICQKAKVEHTKLPGLLQPLPVPKQAWTIISMDFIEVLLKWLRYFYPTSTNYMAYLK
uniref:Reverse transcriptase domain-containing protein n=1 Tax=Arundo donax TaxID=35708 RepID=A0A0A9D1W1_ARUDO